MTLLMQPNDDNVHDSLTALILKFKSVSDNNMTEHQKLEEKLKKSLLPQRSNIFAVHISVHKTRAQGENT